MVRYKQLQTLQGHGGPVFDVAFVDDQRVVTASADRERD